MPTAHEQGLTDFEASNWIGFAVLSMGLAGLQLMLDRGEQKDWFGSTEIITETVIAGLGLGTVLAATRFGDGPLTAFVWAALVQ